MTTATEIDPLSRRISDACHLFDEGAAEVRRLPFGIEGAHAELRRRFGYDISRNDRALPDDESEEAGAFRQLASLIESGRTVDDEDVRGALRRLANAGYSARLRFARERIGGAE